MQFYTLLHLNINWSSIDFDLCPSTGGAVVPPSSEFQGQTDFVFCCMKLLYANICKLIYANIICKVHTIRKNSDISCMYSQSKKKKKKEKEHPYLYQKKLSLRNETCVNHRGLLFTSIWCFEVLLRPLSSQRKGL